MFIPIVLSGLVMGLYIALPLSLIVAEILRHEFITAFNKLIKSPSKALGSLKKITDGKIFPPFWLSVFKMAMLGNILICYIAAITWGYETDYLSVYEDDNSVQFGLLIIMGSYIILTVVIFVREQIFLAALINIFSILWLAFFGYFVFVDFNWLAAIISILVPMGFAFFGYIRVFTKNSHSRSISNDCVLENSGKQIDHFNELDNSIDFVSIKPTPELENNSQKLPQIVHAKKKKNKNTLIYLVSAFIYCFIVTIGDLDHHYDTIEDWEFFFLSLPGNILRNLAPALLIIVAIVKPVPLYFLLMSGALLITTIAYYFFIIGYSYSGIEVLIDLFLYQTVFPILAVILWHIDRYRITGFMSFILIYFFIVSLTIAAALSITLAAVLFPDLGSTIHNFYVLELSNEDELSLSGLSEFVINSMQLAENTRAEGYEPYLEIWRYFFTLIFCYLSFILSKSFFKFLGKIYSQHPISDLMISINSIILIFFIYDSLMIVGPELLEIFTGEFVFKNIQTPLFINFLALFCYLIFLMFGLKRINITSPLTPHSLFFLRVFGNGKKTESLLQDISRRWQYVGPIWLISADDVVTKIIRPNEFFDYVYGKLSSRFIKNEHAINHISTINQSTFKLDNSFPINGLLCTDCSWKGVLSHTIKDMDLIVMDLRGFTSSNQGCLFEIEQLIFYVPLGQVVFLVDETTDLFFFKQTCLIAWKKKTVDLAITEPARNSIQMLHAAHNDKRTVNCLLGLFYAK